MLFSFARTSLVLLSFTFATGCALDSSADDNGNDVETASADDALISATSLRGSWVDAGSSVAMMESLSELALGDDGTYTATLTTMAACPMVGCNVIREVGTFTVSKNKLRLLPEGATTARVYGVTQRTGEIVLTSGLARMVLRAAHWGTNGLQLELTRTGGQLRFDCASGSFDAPLFTDSRGNFSAPGVFVPGFGIEPGPGIPRPGPEAVVYSGHVSRGVMTLEFSIGSGSPQRYTLRAGAPSVLHLCL